MATEGKTPLSEAAPPARGRSQKTGERSKVVRRRAIVGGVIALAVLGVGAYLLSGDDGIIPDIPIINPGPDTPEFAFDSMTFEVTSTTATEEKELTDAAEPAADQIQTMLTDLIQGTFVDPDTWGDYDGVFADAMTEGAAARASQQVRALTLGATANDDYEFMTPERGGLRITVLMGPDDTPVQAAAKVTFVGTAELADGSFTTVTSKGTYLLRIDDGWKIFSFDVRRNEQAVEASPSASVPASPSEEATP